MASADDHSFAVPCALREELRQAAVYATGVLGMRGDPVLQEIVASAAEAAGTPIAAVSILDHDRQWFAASIGLRLEESHRDRSFCSHAIHRPRMPLVVADASLDARFASHALVVNDPHIRFYAGCALMTHDGAPLGALCILDATPRSGFSAQDEAMLRRLAGEVMLEIERLVHLRRFGIEAIERIVDQIRAAAQAGDEELLLALDARLRSVEVKLKGAWS